MQKPESVQENETHNIFVALQYKSNTQSRPENQI